MYLVNKALSRLTDEEYSQCYYKNMGDGGQMRDLLRDGVKGARALMIWNDDEVVSWCLLYPKGIRQRAAQFYTMPAHRGKGYGTILMKEVMKFEKHPFVYPHDERSGRFFKRFKTILCDDYDKEYLK